MSDNLQVQGSRLQRHNVKTRYATSCTECRRRKQKCNQGRPCSNCVRRFPQPTCEYSTKVIKRPAGHGSPNTPHVRVVLEGDAYAHLDLADIQDTILQLEGVGRNVGAGNTLITALRQRARSESSEDCDSAIGSSPPIPEPYQVIVADETGGVPSNSSVQLFQAILAARLKVASDVVNDEWTGDDFMRAAYQAVRLPTMVGGFDDQLRNLPMAHNKRNFELVRIHLQLLSRFKASIDGNPDPESRFMKHWIPLSLKDPLLLQIILYTAACFLNETGKFPKAMVYAYKGAVHQMLNEQLSQRKTQLTDAAIMGIAQMVMDSWYWGSTAELQAHMAGLKSMIQLRGGPQKLGMQGFLAKTVLIHDFVIALAHDLEPTMYGQKGFEFQDDFMVPFQVSFNSPLLSEWPPFRSPTSSLKIHPASAQILDDIRKMIKAVLSLPATPSQQDLRNIKEGAIWSLERLNRMPMDVHVYDGRNQSQYTESGDEGTWINMNEAMHSSPGAYSDASTPRNEPSIDTPPGNTFSDDAGMSPRAIPPPLDIMYRCIRMTASIYLRAIIARVPTTEIVTDAEFVKIWESVWLVTVPVWKSAVGIFIWVTVAAVPSCHQLAQARFIKTLMVVGFMNLGLENWHVAVDAADAALKLQRWLRAGDMEGTRMDDRGVVGGENMIDKHGYIMPDHIPEVAAQAKVDDEDDD